MRPPARDPFSTPPAPVYADPEREPAGRRATRTRPAPPRLGAPPSRASVRRAATALAVASGLWLLALAASQVTGPTVAVPFLARTIAALGDVPSLLALHEPQVRAAASRGGGEAPIAVPGFPVPGATLPRALARDGRPEEWAALLLSRAGEAAYERGPAVFATGDGAGSGGLFSTSRWVRVVMALMSSSTHAIARLAAWGLGLAALALGVLVLATVDGMRRFVTLGLALVGGAAIAAIAGFAGLAVAMVLGASGGSAFVGEVGGLIRGVAWAPEYNAAWMALAGIALAAPAAAAVAWLAREDRPTP